MGKQNKILVVIKEPGQDPYVEHINNSLEDLQEIVGGYIETVTFAEDSCILCNEEGRLMGLPHNINALGVDVVGTVVVVGVKGENFASIKGAHVPLILRMLKEGEA